MEALRLLEKYKKVVWPEVRKYLNNPTYPPSFKIPLKYKKIEKYHWDAVKDYPTRKGKYLRPTLVIMTAEAMGTKPEKAIKTAAGMQISEEWMLIHDDFEDNSLKRRGKPALHHLYGDSLAVNAGDTLHAIMWKVFSDNTPILGHKKTNEILNEFYVQLARTTIGQSAEIVWTRDNKLNITDKDWYFICDGKTSYYTIACPMRLGAIIAGAMKSQLNSLAEFGVYLGRAFQLVDDILDVTSDFKGKKQLGNDIFEGKRTVLLGHLLRNSTPKDKKRLTVILNKPREKKTITEVKWVIDRMDRYKSIEHAKKLADKNKNKAEEIFTKRLKFLSHQPARDNLKKLIHFVIEREY